MAALLQQGATDIRNQLKTLITHVGVSTDQTAFADTQTDLSPDAGATDLIKAVTEADVDYRTTDFTISIDGDSEFTNNAIYTTGVLKGATSADAINRLIRGAGLGIGVQAGDTFTVGIRAQVQDNHT